MPGVPLVSLEPHWTGDGKGNRSGLSFNCPVCTEQPHRIAVGWAAPYEKHWAKSGDTFETITLSPSVDVTKSGRCKFHGYIGLVKGMVTW